MQLNHNYYKLPQLSDWKGRPRSSEKGVQYWYQAIEMGDLQQIVKEESVPTFGLLGYACDEGVKRNLGRPGAKEGPAAFRQKFGKLAHHHPNKKVVDFGDIICNDGNMEAAQQNLSVAIQLLLQNDIVPVVIGGGHDVAYGHGKGLLSPNKKLGIINFDAHFDLRPVESQPNSGTPFFQLLEEHSEQINYCAVGIQKPANTTELFSIAKENAVKVIMMEECYDANIESIKEQLSEFTNHVDQLYITIDLDGFTSAFAPGVSAPSPMGFTPFFVLNMLRHLWSSGKVISLDIAELSPKHDIDATTASLAARIVEYVVGV